MTYFHNDTWDLGGLSLPRYRVSYRVSRFHFSEILNQDNKNAIKQFLYSQIQTSRLTVDTIYSKYRVISNFLIWLGDKNINKLSFIDVEAYSFVLNENNKDATYNDRISKLREFFDYLLMRGHVSENLFEEIGYRNVEPPSQPKNIDDMDMLRLLYGLKQQPLKIKIMFFIVYQGMFISYMLCLKQDCLIFENNICKLKYYDPCARAEEYLVIPKNLYLLIEKYRQKLPDTSFYLFPHSKDPNRPDTGIALHKRIKKLLNSIGPQGGKIDFQLAYLRNNRLLRLFVMGVPLRIIQEVAKSNSLSNINARYENFDNKDFDVLISYMNKNDNEKHNNN